MTLKRAPGGNGLRPLVLNPELFTAVKDEGAESLSLIRRALVLSSPPMQKE